MLYINFLFGISAFAVEYLYIYFPILCLRNFNNKFVVFVFPCLYISFAGYGTMIMISKFHNYKIYIYSRRFILIISYLYKVFLLGSFSFFKDSGTLIFCRLLSTKSMDYLVYFIIVGNCFLFHNNLYIFLYYFFLWIILKFPRM